MFLKEQISQVKLSRAFYWLGIIALAIFFLQSFDKFLKPFVIAILVWFLIRGLSRLFGKIKIGDRSLPRWIRGLLALSVIVAIIFGVFEIVSTNVSIIMEKFPEYEEKFDDLVYDIGQLTGVEDITENIRQINLSKMVGSLLGTATTFVSNFVIIAIYVAFLLIEDSIFSNKVRMLFSTEERYAEFQGISSRIGKSIHTYISAKTVISLITGLLAYIVLLLWGVDLPELWAFLIFLLNFIPYVGSFVATFMPSLFAIFQFNSLIYFVWIYASVQAVQLLVGNFIEPRFMGRSLNLSPLFVLLSLSFWGLIWGVLGMILSVPIAAIVMIILAELPGTRNIAIMMSEKGNIGQLNEQESTLE